MKKVASAGIFETPSPSPGMLIIPCKKNLGTPSGQAGEDALRSRYLQILANEANYASKDSYGPSRLKSLLESDRDREAFFIWAFKQHPEMLSLLYWFLQSAHRDKKALTDTLELIRDAGKILRSGKEITREIIDGLSIRRDLPPKVWK